MNPAPELLAQAHAAIRRPDWPDTVEATLQGPHAAALRLAAWRLGRGQQLTEPPTHRRPPVERPLPPITSLLRERQPGLFDSKRAAAGDRDDE